MQHAAAFCALSFGFSFSEHDWWNQRLKITPNGLYIEFIQ
jgi:hypothetical protein